MIEDTSKGGIDHVIGIARDGQSDYITNMEAEGQRQLVRSGWLPAETEEPRYEYEELGFVFGRLMDPLFCEVTLPTGWSKKPSDHDMWSYIVDEDGHDRVAVFYKAAFYDRRAFMRLVQTNNKEG